MHRILLVCLALTAFAAAAPAQTLTVVLNADLRVPIARIQRG